MKSHLFTPLELGPVTVPNRICVPPMCMCMAKSGIVQIFHKIHYSELAVSGAGAVTVEATAVRPDGRITDADLGLWTDDHVAGLHRLCEVMREVNPRVKIFIQLSHAGCKASTKDGRQVPPAEGGWRPVGPSEIALNEGDMPSRELSGEECLQVIADFGKAAARAAAAGFDGVQIHAAHGYLLHEFLSPLTNHRIDGFGGAREGRMKFPLAVIDAVKESVPESMAVGLRLSATDWASDGITPEDAAVFARAAKDHGVHWLDVSAGGLAPAAMTAGPGWLVAFAAGIRREVGLPTYAVGGITSPAQAETILITGAADGVDVGRGMLDDPRWGWHAARALGETDLPMPTQVRLAQSR
jgi:2,4-dienoyl-CoA reductase-like NADH-dependent reductase (Old Yellow Enzyme family)